MNTDKDPLEQWITSNNDFFNAQEPTEELWQRVKKEIDSRGKERATVFVMKRWLYGAAASILILIVSGIFYFSRQENPDTGREQPVAKTEPFAHRDSNTNRRETKMLVPEDSGTQEKKINNGPEEKEEDEALYHYTRLIEIKQNQLHVLLLTEPHLYKAFTRDLKTLENSYKDLKEQFQQNGDKEQLLEAMIENLKMQTELLNSQLEIYKERRRKDSTLKENKSFSFNARIL
ncbi:hypothetical protein [Niabella beijingensis]|uniref:hypothetical protein n=1 Tax=Niabella beijingensis TaxID=2872700 RepID=UPI001CC13D0D|nr:hypothetical protein [Niabella beijingensis]MBZ4189751.1 hypothetical protein [Niabella beijingensis]